MSLLSYFVAWTKIIKKYPNKWMNPSKLDIEQKVQNYLFYWGADCRWIEGQLEESWWLNSPVIWFIQKFWSVPNTIYSKFHLFFQPMFFPGIWKKMFYWNEIKNMNAKWNQNKISNFLFELLCRQLKSGQWYWIITFEEFVKQWYSTRQKFL